MFERPKISVFALALFFLIAGCSSSNNNQQCPEPDTDIVLPADEAPHDNDMEWWYYTGHLWTTDNEPYGFEVSFFQTWANDQIGYVGHFAISDPTNNEHYYAQRIVAPPGKFTSFDIDVGDWNMRGEGTSDYLVASMDEFSIDLTLTSTKPVAYHAKRGVIEMGAGKYSWYYSKTRMDVSGTLTVAGSDKTVSGMAWHDHQWGDFDVFASDGWDWFSLQLNDNTEIMIFLLNFKESGTSLTGGTFIDADGCYTAFTDFNLQATGSWLSPSTGAEYPMGWTLTIPDHEIDVTIAATVDDQEMDCRSTTLNVYWEGAVEAHGTHAGQAVDGHGFVELAGYGPWGP